MPFRSLTVVPTALPKPTIWADHTLSPAYHTQIALLQQHREADYIVWGQVDAPDTPHAVSFFGITDALTFLGFRQRLFKSGGLDLDALVLVLLMLEQGVRGRKVPSEAVRAQLAREYGESSVRAATQSIGKRDGKVVYTRKDGRVFERGEIPAKQEEFTLMAKELKKVGRFKDILKDLPDTWR
jgi:hypothetical protein